MNLQKKKDLAVRSLGVGRKRLVFNKGRLDDIKEAITRQDIKDLVKDKAIIINQITGSKKVVKRKTRRRAGSIKKVVNTRKKVYMTMTRKFRTYITDMRKFKKVTSEEYWKLRKQIRARDFKSLANLREHINKLVKERTNA